LPLRGLQKTPFKGAIVNPEWEGASGRFGDSAALRRTTKPIAFWTFARGDSREFAERGVFE
jgi:hypothetical protein